MQESDWIEIYTGKGPSLGLVEEGLRSRGFDVVRTPYTRVGGQLEVGIVGTDQLSPYVLQIPREQYIPRRDEVDNVVAVLGAGDADFEAIAEAEEDFDVRGCPRCILFFHHRYDACPGCGTTLVPAVEIFGPDQMGPDRVIVGHGSEAEAKALRDRLASAGFASEASEVEDWTVAAVDVPWQELTDQTAKIEGILRGGTA